MKDCCENGFETRIEPETQMPYALACKQCKPYLRKIQLEKHEDSIEFQDKIIRRANMLKEGNQNVR
jgi:hypothetical protein